MKRVFIIHGWGGNPNEPWMAWLKQELKRRGIEVISPFMPDTDSPKIDAWVSCLVNAVGAPDKDTCFVGHSIGCQTILRYLETVSVPVGPVVLVAPWFDLKPDSYESEEEKLIAKPWIETPIDFEKIKKAAKNIYAIYSDDDYFVPLETGNILKEKLGARVVLETGKQHYSPGEADKIPQVLEELI